MLCAPDKDLRQKRSVLVRGVLDRDHEKAGVGQGSRQVEIAERLLVIDHSAEPEKGNRLRTRRVLNSFGHGKARNVDQRPQLRKCLARQGRLLSRLHNNRVR